MLDPKSILEYLQGNPQFFSDHQQELLNLSIPHPLYDRTVSLHQYHLLTLRTQNKRLDSQIKSLITEAHRNQNIQTSLHQFTLALLALDYQDQPISTLETHLRQTFSVEAAHILRTQKPLKRPILHLKTNSTLIKHHFSAQLPALRHIQSWCGFPLPQSRYTVFLGSQEPQRFSPDMNCHFLYQLQDLLDTALQKHNPACLPLR